MAKEITVSVELTINKLPFSYSRSFSGQFDWAGTAYTSQVQNIGTSVEQVVVGSDVSSAGYAVFINLDTTNYIQLEVDDAGTKVPFARLKAGQAALIPLDGTAIYAKANTAACNLEYAVFSA